MIAENQIREELGRYLSKEISLDQFEDWFAQRSWNMHLDSAESAQKLASSIELRLAEHSSGHLEEPALRDELRAFVNSSTMKVWFGAPVALVSQEPPNNITVEGSHQGFQVALTPAIAPQVVAEFFDTELEAARA